MFRAAASTVAKRAAVRSARGVPTFVPSRVGFHASSRQEEEAKPVAAVEPSKGGLFGTGLSEWYALPIGLVAAIPIIKFDWYVINEETQLMAVFIAFCVTVYKQGGDAIYESLDANAKAILKEQNEAEDKVIEALEQKLEFLKANVNMVNDFEAINTIREKAYADLNAAGKIKPKHDLKAQVERVIQMIAQEETNVAEKAKTALMDEATDSVTSQFQTSKELKKAALDAAINTIKSGKMSASDPVQSAFVDFFKAKAAAAKKADDGSEAAAQRANLIAKLNAVAKSENMFFNFDESGKPKMA